MKEESIKKIISSFTFQSFNIKNWKSFLELCEANGRKVGTKKNIKYLYTPFGFLGDSYEVYLELYPIKVGDEFSCKIILFLENSKEVFEIKTDKEAEELQDTLEKFKEKDKEVSLYLFNKERRKERYKKYIFKKFFEKERGNFINSDTMFDSKQNIMAYIRYFFPELECQENYHCEAVYNEYEGQEWLEFEDTAGYDFFDYALFINSDKEYKYNISLYKCWYDEYHILKSEEIYTHKLSSIEDIKEILSNLKEILL